MLEVRCHQRRVHVRLSRGSAGTNTLRPKRLVDTRRDGEGAEKAAIGSGPALPGETHRDARATNRNQPQRPPRPPGWSDGAPSLPPWRPRSASRPPPTRRWPRHTWEGPAPKPEKRGRRRHERNNQPPPGIRRRWRTIPIKPANASSTGLSSAQRSWRSSCAPRPQPRPVVQDLLGSRVRPARPSANEQGIVRAVCRGTRQSTGKAPTVLDSRGSH